MANYCNNSLYIRGSNDDLKAFSDKHLFLKQDHPSGQPDLSFSFQSVLPQVIEYGYYADSEIWGTKSDADDYGSCHVTIETDHIFISFDTAWTPPTPVIEKLSELFPKLQFQLFYMEEGSGFTGEQYAWQQGMLAWDNAYDYGTPEYRKIKYTEFSEPELHEFDGEGDEDDKQCRLYLEETNQI